jgi:hypothetical protein
MVNGHVVSRENAGLGKGKPLSRCDPLRREWAKSRAAETHAIRAVLFSSKPGELLKLDAYVSEDLTHEPSPDVFTLVDGDDRCPTVVVLPEGMAPLVSDQPKSQAGEDGL